LARDVRAELNYRNSIIFVLVQNSGSVEQVREQIETAHAKEVEKGESRWREKEATLLARHHAESEDFERRWAEEIPAKYRKQSPKLLQLLEIEKRSGKVAMFEQAALVRAEVTVEQEKEQRLAQETIVHKYDLARAQLERDQREERDSFYARRAEWTRMMDSQLAVKLQSVTNREIVIKAKRDQAVRRRDTSMVIMARETPPTAPIKKAEAEPPLVPPLLPPLVAPNDPRIQELKEKKKADQQTRNKRFKEWQDERFREEQRSEINSPREDEEPELESQGQTEQTQNPMPDLIKGAVAAAQAKKAPAPTKEEASQPPEADVETPPPEKKPTAKPSQKPKTAAKGSPQAVAAPVLDSATFQLTQAESRPD
jgi:hypothetical protein